MLYFTMKTYIIAHLQNREGLRTATWSFCQSAVIVNTTVFETINERFFLLLLRLMSSSLDTATTRLTAHFMWPNV